MHGIPCLHCTTSLAYIDADEDTEHLLSFADASAPSTCMVHPRHLAFCGNHKVGLVDVHGGR